jgi:hypothetical protein
MNIRLVASVLQTGNCNLMKYCLFLILVFPMSCKQEINVSGIIVDKTSRHPLKNVQVRTIRDAKSSGIDFVSTTSLNNGSFILTYEVNHLNKDSMIALELSKGGYVTNIYMVSQDVRNDTIFLERHNLDRR